MNKSSEVEVHPRLDYVVCAITAACGLALANVESPVGREATLPFPRLGRAARGVDVMLV